MNSYKNRATEAMVRILEKVADSIDELGDTTASIPEMLAIYSAVMDRAEGPDESAYRFRLENVSVKDLSRLVSKPGDIAWTEEPENEPDSKDGDPELGFIWDATKSDHNSGADHSRAWDGTRDEPEDEYDLIGKKKERPLGQHVLLADIDTIPTRAVNALKNKGVVETFQLTHMTRDELMNIRGIGTGAMDAIEDWMGEHGMALAG